MQELAFRKAKAEETQLPRLAQLLDEAEAGLAFLLKQHSALHAIFLAASAAPHPAAMSASLPPPPPRLAGLPPPLPDSLPLANPPPTYPLPPQLPPKLPPYFPPYSPPTPLSAGPPTTFSPTTSSTNNTPSPTFATPSPTFAAWAAWRAATEAEWSRLHGITLAGYNAQVEQHEQDRSSRRRATAGATAEKKERRGSRRNSAVPAQVATSLPSTPVFGTELSVACARDDCVDGVPLVPFLIMERLRLGSDQQGLPFLHSDGCVPPARAGRGPCRPRANACHRLVQPCCDAVGPCALPYVCLLEGLSIPSLCRMPVFTLAFTAVFTAGSLLIRPWPAMRRHVVALHVPILPVGV